MARYIDAEIPKKNTRANLMPNVDIDGTITVENAERHFLNLIDKTPTADVEEVRHGEWVLMGTEMFMDGSYASKLCCSLCSREVGVCHEHDSDKYSYAKVMYPYCHCGAKMDGTQKEG